MLNDLDEATRVKTGHSCEGHKRWLSHKPVRGTKHTKGGL